MFRISGFAYELSEDRIHEPLEPAGLRRRHGLRAFAWPDVLLPLVAAAEIAYLGLLGTHPRFQQYVNAQAAKVAREASSVDKQQALDHIMKSLPKEILARFQTLRSQCMDLRQIAAELKRPGIGADDAPLDQFQVTGLDRLLWIHLRMLYTQYALSQFLKRTSADQINQSIARLEQQVKQLPADENDPVRQRFRAALEDNLNTSRARLANLNKARENYQLFERRARPPGEQDPLFERDRRQPARARVHHQRG